MKTQGNIIYRFISSFLVFILLLNNLVYADPDVIKYNKRKSTIDFLAPRSNFEITVNKEYGVSAYSVLAESSDSVAKTIFINNKRSNDFKLWIKRISAEIVKNLKKISIKSLSPLILFIVLFFQTTVAGAQTADYNQRLHNYQEFVSYQIEEGLDIDEVRENVFQELRANTDPAIKQASINLAVEHWPGQLENLFSDPDISQDLLKEIILARFYSDNNPDFIFLSEIIEQIGNSPHYDMQKNLFTFSLSLAKSELLSNKEAFINIASKDPNTIVAQMNLLMVVIETESENSIIRSEAVDRFLSGFRSNDELALFILSYDESLINPDIITRPFAVRDGQLSFLKHSLTELKQFAEEELKARIAANHLNTRVGKKYLGSEFVERFVENFMGGSNKSFAPFMLESVRNHNYPEQGMQRFLPDIHEMVLEQYEQTLLKQQEEINNNSNLIGDFSSLNKEFPEFSSLAGMSSDFQTLKKKAIDNLAAKGVSYLFISSENPNLRIEARELIKNDLLSLMHLYLAPTANESDREYSEQRIEILLKDQSGNAMVNGINYARINSSFRNGLIDIFKNSTSLETKNYCLNIYLRSSNDIGELITFAQQLEAELRIGGLSTLDLEILKDGVNNEIKRMVAFSLLSRKVGIENSSTSAITFHNKPFEIIEIEQYISALNNPNSNIKSVLPAEISAEVDEAYEALKNPNNNQINIVKPLTENYGILSFLIIAGFIFFSGVLKKIGRRSKKENSNKKSSENQELLANRKYQGKSYIGESSKSRKRVEATLKRRAVGGQLLDLIDKIKKTPEKFTELDAKKLYSFIRFHSAGSVISAEDENTVINLLSRMILIKKNPDSAVNNYFQMILKVLLYKIKEQNFTSPSSPEGSVELDTIKEEETYENKGFVKKVIDGLKGKTLLSGELIEKIGAIDGTFKKMFTEKFNKTRKKMICVVGFLTGLQFALLFIPSLLVMFTAAPVSLIGIWAIVIGAQVILEAFKLYYSEKTSYEVDKSLKILLQTASSKYKIGGLPTTKNISQGVKARWGLIQLIASSIPISLAIIAIQPIFFVPFMIAFSLCLGIILYNTFHKNGMAEALEDYEKEMDRLGKRWSIYNYLSKQYDIHDNAGESVKKFKKYIRKSIIFSASLLLLITFVIPGIAFLAGFTAYGIVVSGYLGFMLIAFDPVKRMTKGIFHVQKLTKMVDFIHEQEMFKWEKEWSEKRDGVDKKNDYLNEGWHVESIIGDDISIFAPNRNEKNLLINQNFEFHKGNRVTFAAFSGAGKSQTAKTLGFLRPHNSGSYKLKIKNSETGDERIVEAKPENFSLESLREKIHYNDLKSYSERTLRELILFNNGLDALEIKNIAERLKYLDSKSKKDLSRKESLEIKDLKLKYNTLKDKASEIENSFIEEHGRNAIDDDLTNNDTKILNFTKTELEIKLDQPVKDFSEGEQLRIKLALIFGGKAKKADFIILDEPFARIQSNLKVKISSFLKEWQKKYGSCVIIIDHHPRDEMESDIVVSFSNSQLVDYKHVEVQSYMKNLLEARGINSLTPKGSEKLPFDLLEQLEKISAGDYESTRVNRKKISINSINHLSSETEKNDITYSENNKEETPYGKEISAAGISLKNDILKNLNTPYAQKEVLNDENNSEPKNKNSTDESKKIGRDLDIEERKLKLEGEQIDLDQRKLDYQKKLIELEEKRNDNANKDTVIETEEHISLGEESDSSTHEENKTSLFKKESEKKVESVKVIAISSEHEKIKKDLSMNIIEHQLARDQVESDKLLKGSEKKYFYELNEDKLLSYMKTIPEQIYFPEVLNKTAQRLIKKFRVKISEKQHDVFSKVESQVLFFYSLINDKPYSELENSEKNLTLQALKMKIRFDALQNLNSTEQNIYIETLRNSIEVSDQLFAMLLAEEKLKSEKGLTNLAFKKVFKRYIENLSDENYLPIQEIIPQLKIKSTNNIIEEIITKNDELIRNQVAVSVECLFNLKKTTGKLPRTLNVSDLFNITNELKNNDVLINENTPKVFFQFKWPTFQRKMSLIKKYALPLNSSSLKLYKTRKSQQENENTAIEYALVNRLKEVSLNNNLIIKDLTKNKIRLENLIGDNETYKWRALFEVSQESHGLFAKIFFNSKLNEKFNLNDEEEVIIFNKLLLAFDELFKENIPENNLKEQMADEAKLIKFNSIQDEEVNNSYFAEEKSNIDTEASYSSDKEIEKSVELLIDDVQSKTLQNIESEEPVISIIQEENNDKVAFLSNKESEVQDNYNGKDNELTETTDNFSEEKKISAFAKISKTLATLILVIALPVTFLLTACDSKYNKTDNLQTTNVIQGSEMENWNNTNSDFSDNSSLADVNVQRTVPASFVISGDINTIRSEFNGRIVSRIPNGTHVKQGDVLVTYSSENREIESQINDLRQLYQDHLNEYNLANARLGLDIAKTQVEFLEIQKENTLRCLNDLQARYGNGTIRSPFDGVFYDRPFFQEGKTTPEIGEYFNSGVDIGYLRADSSEMQEIQLMFKTADIYSVLLDETERPTIELMIDGKKIKTEIRGWGDINKSFNLSYSFSCVIPRSEVAISDVSNIKILIQNRNINENLNQYRPENFHQLNGVAYYPEKIDWNFSYGGIVQGIADSSYTGYASVSTLNKFMIINNEIAAVNSGDRKLLNHYLTQYNAYKKLYGENVEATLKAHRLYTELASKVNQSTNILQETLFSIQDKENWVISDINIRNGEYLPPQSRDSKNESYLQILNPSKVNVFAQAGYELLDTLNNYRTNNGEDPIIIIQVGDQQFNASIKERHVDANEGLLNLTFEINSENGDFIIPFENAPVQILIQKSPLINNTDNIQGTKFNENDQSAVDINSSSAIINDLSEQENDFRYAEASLGMLLGLIGFEKSKSKKTEKNTNEENPLKGIYGSYALFSLFPFLNKRDSLCQKKLIGFILSLLKEGYSLKVKNNQKKIGINEIKEYLDKGEENLTDLLALVLPKNIAIKLAEAIIKSDFIYSEEFLIDAIYKQKATAIEYWPIITDPLFGEQHSLNDKDLFYWIDNWLKWLPEKIKSVDNYDLEINAYLDLDFHIILTLLNVLNEKIYQSSNDTNLEKILYYKKEFLNCRDNILRKKEINRKYFNLLINDLKDKTTKVAKNILNISSKSSETEIRNQMLKFWEDNLFSFYIDEFVFIFENINESQAILKTNIQDDMPDYFQSENRTLFCA